MNRYMRVLSAAAIALPCWLAFTPESASAATGTFTFDDINYWVGEGTNRAVVLIDYDFRGRAAGVSNSLAYGFRWNGEITQLEALRLIGGEDKRLHFSTYESWGSTLPEAFAYDRKGNGGAFALSDGLKTDPGDIIESCNSDTGWNFYWATTELTNSTTFTENFRFITRGGIASEYMIPDSFLGLMFLPWATTWNESIGEWDAEWNPLPYTYPETGDYIDFIPSMPVAAESPYGFRVFGFESDTSANFAGNYIHPEAAVGRPAASTLPKDADQYDGPAIPLTPLMGAMGTNQVLRLVDIYDDFGDLETRGCITIEFDHPVVDDPNNPWGLDFIVFGNAFYQGNAGSENMTGFENPTNVIVRKVSTNNPEILVAEPGLVAVSQDRETWFTSDTWLHADSFAPTLGYKLDPANANPALFAGNKWWGAKTDPTYPVPPWGEESIAPGTNLAQIATWYNGSAGGAAFDISSLDLPATHNGRKWFKYVRITNNANPDDGSSSCEIDAVADVYPDTPYGVYAKELYAWTELPSKGRKTALAANGRPNFVNFALGEDPAATLEISDFVVRDGRLWFSFPVWKADWNINDMLESGIDFSVRAKSKLTNAGSGNNVFGFASFEGLTTNSVDGTYTATISVDELPTAQNAFFRLGISAEE